MTDARGGPWEAARRALARRRECPDPAPVFILGNQKSGTTAIAGLLAAATGLPATLDFFHRLAPDVLPALLEGRRHLDDLIRDEPWIFAPPIVKEPSLTFLRDSLSETFPAARFAFVLRDPRDNLRSILDRLKLSGTRGRLDAADQTRLAELPGWRMILDGHLFGHAGTDIIETLSRRWMVTLQIYEAHRGSDVLIRYEDFEADKPGSIRRLARRVGLRGTHDITARLDEAFQPRGDRSRRWLDVFGPDNLARIEAICGPGMERMGYPRSAT